MSVNMLLVFVLLFQGCESAPYHQFQRRQIPLFRQYFQQQNNYQIFEPRNAFKLNFVAEFDCTSYSAEEWAESGKISLKKFTNGLGFDTNIVLQRRRHELEKKLNTIAQKISCAVRYDPDNVMYLKELAAVSSRSIYAANKTNALGFILRCLELSSMKLDSQLMWQACTLHGQLKGRHGKMEDCFNIIRTFQCTNGKECVSQAAAFKELKEPQRVIDSLERAIVFDPSEPTSHIALLQKYIEVSDESDTIMYRYRKHRRQFVSNLDAVQIAQTAPELNWTNFLISPKNKTNTVASVTNIKNHWLLNIREQRSFNATRTLNYILRSAIPENKYSYAFEQSLQDFRARSAAIKAYRQQMSYIIGKVRICQHLQNDVQKGPSFLSKLTLHMMIVLMEKNQHSSQNKKFSSYPLILHEPYVGPPLNTTHFHVSWGEHENDADMSKYDYPMMALLWAQSICSAGANLSSPIFASLSTSSLNALYLRSVWLMDQSRVENMLTIGNVDLMAVDGFGTNALQYAIIRGDVHMLSTLLSFDHQERLADVFAQDMFGNSALSMVRNLPRHSFWDMIRCLVEWYAKPASGTPPLYFNVIPNQLLDTCVIDNIEFENFENSGQTSINEMYYKVSNKGAKDWTTLTRPTSINYRQDAAIVDARNVSLIEIVRKYISVGRPVVIRNALGQCPALEGWSRSRLIQSNMSQLHFQVVDGHSRTVESLRNFIMQRMSSIENAASVEDWNAQICNDNTYIAQHLEAGWKSSPLGKANNDVPSRMEPISSVLECIPPSIQEYFQTVSSQMPGAWMQWAMTIGSCSGAQLHFHESALNIQLFGTKRWFYYPTAHSTSNKQMRSGHWFHKVLPTLKAHERPLEFTQHPGDIAVLPRQVTHATMCYGECASLFWVQSAFNERPNLMGPFADFLWSAKEHRHLINSDILLTDDFLASY